MLLFQKDKCFNLEIKFTTTKKNSSLNIMRKHGKKSAEIRVSFIVKPRMNTRIEGAERSSEFVVRFSHKINKPRKYNSAVRMFLVDSVKL
mgnify:CR=1 FL=1